MMKNLLVFISQEKKFNEECALLAKIQIDNSLSLGWKKEDILFVTNYPYEYNGVKAITVGDDNYCAARPRSIKTSVISHLIERGIIEKGKLYWNHDFDAYQLSTIEESELGLENMDLGLTDYGWRDRWCMGSYFFKESAKDIFEFLRDGIFKNIEDETVMMGLTGSDVNNVNKRSKRLNVTYNFGQRNIESNYEKATKPLKVLHFHLSKRGLLDVFMYGKSGLNIPLMTERFIGILNYHGIK